MQILLHEKQNLYIFKNSKFIGYCFQVNDENEVNFHLKQIKTNHPNANHICYAYIINAHCQKYNDDNEPRHSAGWTIWELLKLKNLSQCLIVVVRYFRGAKLGVHNLAKSYLNTAKLLLDNNIQQHIDLVSLQIKFHYKEINYWTKIINTHKIQITHKTYMSNCVVYELLVPNVVEILNLFKNNTN